jgi:cobalamin transport system permease protein
LLTVKKLISVLCGLGLLLIGTFVLGLSLGSVAVPITQGIWGEGLDSTSRAILFELRLPRVLLAGIVGWSLSVVGVVFQALMRNPLAEPFLLGISSGAAVGAVAGIILGILFWGGIPLMAFMGALMTITLVLVVAQKARALDPNTLILTGVIVNAFFAAVIMVALATTAGEKLHSMLFWLYGDLSRGQFQDFLFLVPVTVVCSFILYATARSYNLIAAGEETASQLGIAVEKVKWLSLILVSLMCGVTVAFSGIIGLITGCSCPRPGSLGPLS